jgi:hypothetical protein
MSVAVRRRQARVAREGAQVDDQVPQHGPHLRPRPLARHPETHGRPNGGTGRPSPNEAPFGFTAAAPKIRPGIGHVARQNRLPRSWRGHRSGGRASVVPNPVRWHRPRRAVLPSHELVAGSVCRGTSRGRHSAPRAPQESGATIPGTQRRPGQTDERARGSTEDRPPTRPTPPATKNYQKAAQFSSSRVPRSGISDCLEPIGKCFVLSVFN